MRVLEPLHHHQPIIFRLCNRINIEGEKQRDNTRITFRHHHPLMITPNTMSLSVSYILSIHIITASYFYNYRRRRTPLIEHQTSGTIYHILLFHSVKQALSPTPPHWRCHTGSPLCAASYGPVLSPVTFETLLHWRPFTPLLADLEPRHRLCRTFATPTLAARPISHASITLVQPAIISLPAAAAQSPPPPIVVIAVAAAQWLPPPLINLSSFHFRRQQHNHRHHQHFSSRQQQLNHCHHQYFSSPKKNEEKSASIAMWCPPKTRYAIVNTTRCMYTSKRNSFSGGTSVTARSHPLTRTEATPSFNSGARDRPVHRQWCMFASGDRVSSPACPSPIPAVALCHRQRAFAGTA